MKRQLLHKYRYLGYVMDEDGRDLIKYIDLPESEWRQTRASSYDKALSQIKYKIRNNLRYRGIFVARGIINLNEKDIVDLDSEPVAEEVSKGTEDENNTEGVLNQLSLFED